MVFQKISIPVPQTANMQATFNSKSLMFQPKGHPVRLLIPSKYTVNISGNCFKEVMLPYGLTFILLTGQCRVQMKMSDQNEAIERIRL